MNRISNHVGTFWREWLAGGSALGTATVNTTMTIDRWFTVGGWIVALVCAFPAYLAIYKAARKK